MANPVGCVLLLAIDWLALTTAVATAGTLVAVVGIAAFEAWIHRAWLSVELAASGPMRAGYVSSRAHVRLGWDVEVRNRSRRANTLVGVGLYIEEPAERTFAKSEICTMTFPMDIDSPGSQTIHLSLTLYEDEQRDWWGKSLKGRISVMDIHGKRYWVTVDNEIPADKTHR